MSRKTALLVLSLAATAALGALSGPGAFAARRSHRCDAHRAYRRDPYVVIYRQQAGDDGVGNPLTVYYACARPGGASIAIASNSYHGEYSPDDVLEELVLRANYAGALMIQGEGDQSVCEKYAQPHCPTPHTVVTAADVRHRRVLAMKVAAGAHGLVLSPSRDTVGAAAWLVPQGSGSSLVGGLLVPRGNALKTAPYTIDSGAISHVRLRGETISWLNGTTPHQAVLHAVG